jgi:hypothetical protein
MTSRYFPYAVRFALLVLLLLVGAVTMPAQASPDSCQEALASSGCMLRWEVDASAATGSSNQTSSNTTPNLLFKLDYQLASPKDPMITRQVPKQTAGERFATHLVFKTGYTQVPVAAKVTLIGSPASAAPASCPGTAPTAATATCAVATTQQAFVADAAFRIGWTFGRDGQGTFSEIGFAARSALQDVVPVNQVIQSGGFSFADLSSSNLNNLVGLYEGTFHFRLGQIGHDTPAGANGKYANVSDLLIIEAGYQVDTGLTQLNPTNPQASTRGRIVGRFYAYPELPGPTHTKILVGMEYSGGIHGGPQVIQLFWGTSLNLATLIKPSN